MTKDKRYKAFKLNSDDATAYVAILVNEKFHFVHVIEVKTVIYLPSENITGQIEAEGTIIEWSNGTYWSRESFSGPEPPQPAWIIITIFLYKSYLYIRKL